MTTVVICPFHHSTARIVAVLVRSSLLTPSALELAPSILSSICRAPLSLHGWLFRAHSKLARAKQVNKTGLAIKVFDLFKKRKAKSDLENK